MFSLVDFGLCEETERIVRNPRMVGSPYWMPPEIILKAPYAEKVDVWSLGVTLLELIDKKGFDLGTGFNVCIFFNNFYFFFFIYFIFNRLYLELVFMEDLMLFLLKVILLNYVILFNLC